jgi:hypothetical protein
MPFIILAEGARKLVNSDISTYVINKWGGYFKYPENNRKRAVDFV